MKKEILKHLVILTVLALIGLVLFVKTFQLEIFGDEWQGIWWTTSALQRTGTFNDRTDYKTYETAATLLNIVSGVGASSSSYSSTSVYLFSFITRLLAAYCLYYFLIRRELSYKASFLGALLFLVTPIGIQATEWAKNFTSYISIALFLLCIDSIYVMKSWKNFLIFLITFSLSIYVNPIRAHGIIMTIVFLLLLQTFFNKSIRKIYKPLLLISVIGIFFLFSKMMIFADSSVFQSLITKKIILLSTQFLEGNLQRITDLFILIGRGLIPQPSVGYVLLLTVSLLFWKRNLLSRQYFLFLLLSHVIFLIFIFKYIFSFPQTSTAILGIYFSVFMIIIFLIELFKKNFLGAMSTILPFLLNITFVIIPWILGNTDITESTHRYLIYPALSVPLIIAFSLNTNKSILPSLFISLLFFGMFISSTQSEINRMYKNHNQTNAKIIWQQITPYFEGVDFNSRRPIILFESDNPAMLQDTVMFGINYRLGFLYKVWDEDKLPIPLDGVETLKSMLEDGKASKRYIGKEFVFPKEDAFYFRIIGNSVNKVDISELFTQNQAN